jgi:hypothetical protein
MTKQPWLIDLAQLLSIGHRGMYFWLKQRLASNAGALGVLCFRWGRYHIGSEEQRRRREGGRERNMCGHQPGAEPFTTGISHALLTSLKHNWRRSVLNRPISYLSLQP